MHNLVSLDYLQVNRFMHPREKYTPPPNHRDMSGLLISTNLLKQLSSSLIIQVSFLQSKDQWFVSFHKSVEVVADLSSSGTSTIIENNIHDSTIDKAWAPFLLLEPKADMECLYFESFYRRKQVDRAARLDNYRWESFSSQGMISNKPSVAVDRWPPKAPKSFSSMWLNKVMVESFNRIEEESGSLEKGVEIGKF